MILNVLMFKNIVINAFTQPIFDDHNPEDVAVQLERSLILEKDSSKIAAYKNLELYQIATFDDLSGELKVMKPTLLLNCHEVMKRRDDYVESSPIARN